MTLARYRLRPVPWLPVAVAAVFGALTAALGFGAAADPVAAYGRLVLFAELLGLGGALLTAPETDPHSEVLEPLPRAPWRTTIVRLAAWALLGGVLLGGLALVLSGSRGWSGSQLLGVLPAFALLTGLTAAVAARSSALLGAATGLAALFLLRMLPLWQPRLPLQLALAPADPLAPTARTWVLALAATLLVVVVGERYRRGLSLRSRPRRHSGRAGADRRDAVAPQMPR